MTGIAGALLVFAGVWHASEWAMGGRNRDTARLIPLGIVYLVLGYLIVTFRFMPAAGWIAFAVTALGLFAALSMRGTSEIRPWVTWAFILIDAAILLALATGLIT